MTVIYLISVTALAKSNINIGHYYVDAPKKSYQFSSLSFKHKQKSWVTKISIPYIQTNNGEAGLGNIALKLSHKWRRKHYMLRTHFKQKIASANSKVVTPVTDKAFSLELNYGFSWGMGFIESGHWWREDKFYERENSWFGSIGIMKPFKLYTLAFIVDHKPTALGKVDSMTSVLIQKPLSPSYSASLLFATGLSSDSPNVMLGLQLSHKI